MGKCKQCDGPIEKSRLDIGKTICYKCADTPLLKGRPAYGHKTGSEIDIVAPGFFHASAKYYRRKGKNCNLGSFFDRKS